MRHQANSISLSKNTNRKGRKGKTKPLRHASLIAFPCVPRALFGERFLLFIVGLKANWNF
jgi:hypothetical protein